MVQSSSSEARDARFTPCIECLNALAELDSDLYLEREGTRLWPSEWIALIAHLDYTGGALQSPTEIQWRIPNAEDPGARRSCAPDDALGEVVVDPAVGGLVRYTIYRLPCVGDQLLVCDLAALSAEAGEPSTRQEWSEPGRAPVQGAAPLDDVDQERVVWRIAHVIRVERRQDCSDGGGWLRSWAQLHASLTHASAVVTSPDGGFTRTIPDCTGKGRSLWKARKERGHLPVELQSNPSNPI